MMNRGSAASPGSAIDSAAHAQRASINETNHPIVHSSFSFSASPGSSSLVATRARGRGGGVTAAGRRTRPEFKLSDMNPETGGGAIGAGLGAGRPSLAEARRGPSSFDTPFANFNKIVCVSLSFFRYHEPNPTSSPLLVILLDASTSPGKPFCMLRASIFPMDHLML